SSEQRVLVHSNRSRVVLVRYTRQQNDQSVLVPTAEASRANIVSGSSQLIQKNPCVEERHRSSSWMSCRTAIARSPDREGSVLNRSSLALITYGLLVDSSEVRAD